jgi:hypothetical protein
MIGLFLLLSAQAPATAPADTSPPAPPPPTAQVCRRAPGSDNIVCTRRAVQGSYRLQKLPPQAYGPALPSAQSVVGHGVKVGAQTTNRGPGRRNRSMATVGIPF